MKRILATLLLAAGTVASAQQSHTERIMDPTLGIPYATVQVPNGWRLQSTVAEPACASGRGYPQFRLTSPDGSITIEQLPPFFAFSAPVSNWKGNIQSCGVENVKPMPARATLTRYILPFITRGSKVSVSRTFFDIPTKTLRAQNFVTDTDAAAQVVVFGSDPAHPTVHIVIVSDEILHGEGGFDQGTTTPTVVTTPDDEKAVRAAFAVMNQLNITVNPAWMQPAVAHMNQVSRQQNDAMRQRGAQTRAAMAQDGQQKVNAIAANAQQQMAASRAYGEASVANIQATGAASMANARAMQQASSDAAFGTAMQMNNKTAGYGWCSNGQRQITDSTTPPGYGWSRCN